MGFFNFFKKSFASVKVMSNKPIFIWEIGGPKPLGANVLHNESQHYLVRSIEFLPFGPSIWLKGGQHLPKQMG